jgi:hypothetical protein
LEETDQSSVEQRITFLCDLDASEKQNIVALAAHADKMVYDYFNKQCDFDVIICDGSWSMEVQTISRRKSNETLSFSDTRSISLTDSRLKEIVLRKDKAKFGHYLHEMIYAVTCRGFPEQLREALAWFFTLELTESCRYVRPNYSGWVTDLYLAPARNFVQMLGKDFVKDFAVGDADVDDSILPDDIHKLFFPEEFYHSNAFIKQ